MSAPEPVEGARRYLKSREKPWAHALARGAKSMGLTPNMISVLSVVFAILAAYCLMHASEATYRHEPEDGAAAAAFTPSKPLACLLWCGAIAGIQLRLLCNLLDGMVAIEGGMKSVLGGLFNEVPDRIADPLILLAAGYSNDWVVKLFGIPLGWVAAVLAVLTAYIRVLGGTLVGTQSFIGPMAKQHRMFILTIACVGAMIEQCTRADGRVSHVMEAALALIVVGCVATCWRRLALIAGQLREKSSPN